jgi:DNA-binding MarR family transcriptional regulator
MESLDEPTMTRGLDEFALVVADVYDAAGVLRRYGERIAASAGQTQARWQLLSVVSGGDWTVPMAADRLGISRQAVQRIANDVVADDLAVFEVNPQHRRSPFLRLTATGKQALTAMTDQAQRSHRALAAKLRTLDLMEVRSALQELTAAVRADLDGAGDLSEP